MSLYNNNQRQRQQSLLQADAEFYATFPDARLAAERQWQPIGYDPCTVYSDTITFSYDHEAVNAQDTCPYQAVDSAYWQSHYSTPSSTLQDNNEHVESTYIQQQQPQHHHQQQPYQQPPTTSFFPQPVPQQPHVDSPAEYPTSPQSDYDDYRSSSVPSPYHATTSSHTDIIQPKVESPEAAPSPLSPQPSHYSPTISQADSSKAPARAMTWSGPTRPSSPRSMRLSPLPLKRPLEKKPPLACLFCRGRKIACGPPLPGSPDRTCNQCQRRSLQCEYPSESRRGMRKKKTLPTETSDLGPAPNPNPIV
ncbi:hypothetical protein BJ165DRAFT_1401584 [Panaeolus papilionaceus]|nr:hypothetical protein BJ165DRAFT_1401584 [Panaeolus papilionaceus]